MPRLLQQYVFRELISPFAVSMMVFIFILLAGKIIRLVEMVVDWGVNPLEAGHFVLFIIPTFLGFTFPMAVLLAVLVGFGRMSADGELTAMKSSGISLYQLMLPVVAFSLLGVTFSLYFMMYGLPWGKTGFRELLFAVAKKRADLGVQEQVFNDSFKGLVIYVNSMDRQSGGLEGILISDARDMEEPATIVARQGRIYADPGSLTLGIMLQDGSIHRMDSHDGASETVQFERYQLKLEPEEKFSQREITRRKFEQMYPLELWQNAHEPELREDRRLRALTILHEKAAIPLACLIMGLLAVPLGIMWSSAGRFHGFVLGTIVILSYYALLILGETLAKSGTIPPFPGVWIPNAVFGTLAIYLVRSAARERENLMVAWINERAARVVAGLERFSRRF